MQKSFCTYSTTIDKYITLFGIYTEDEMTYFDRLEKEHKENLTDYSYNELLQIFPEAKNIAKKHLKAEIKACKEDLAEADRIEREGKQLIEWRCVESDKWFYEGILQEVILPPLTTIKIVGALDNGWLKTIPYDREKIIKRNSFIIAGMERKKEIETSGVTDNQIEEAKRVPIKNFIKVDRTRKALCPFHNDHSPSMHVYPDNHFYCFVCGKSGDVVDLVMHLNNMNFISAVKSLI